jgi:hypothetical protein
MDSHEYVQVDEQVVQQLAETAQVMTGMLERMLETHEVQSKDMEHFREDLCLVRDAIARIARVLHEGNGQKPLIARVAVLEERVSSLLKEISRKAEEKTAARIVSKKGKYALGVAIITGVTALATQLVSLIW